MNSGLIIALAILAVLIVLLVLYFVYNNREVALRNEAEAQYILKSCGPGYCTSR